MQKTIFEQLETYSRSVVAFTVLQGLAYSFYFGTSETFNCFIKMSSFLPECLTVLFLVVLPISIIAISYSGKRMEELAPEYSTMLQKITLGKIAIVIFFGLFPAALTFFYGVMARAPDNCKRLLE